MLVDGRNERETLLQQLPPTQSGGDHHIEAREHRTLNFNVEGRQMRWVLD